MKTAICAIIKDEHAYLKEWIDWHLGIGFTDIHLLEDSGSSSHAEITSKYKNVFLRRYATDKDIQEGFKAYTKGNNQERLYFWFCDNFNDEYDWVACIDVDEFVFFENGYSLAMLCEEFSESPAVLLYWKMMGANGHIKKPDAKVVEAYTKQALLLQGEECWCYKSFINLKRYQGFTNLHLACGAVKTNYMANPDDLYVGESFDKAWINHYFTKSWEEWCNRIYKRGGTINGHRTLSQFFEVNVDMKHLKKQLINEVVDRKPNGSYWIDKEEYIIAGGNFKKISEKIQAHKLATSIF